MPWTRTAATTTQRGYGNDHQKARRAYLAELEREGVGVCCIGGEPIHPGQELHLDHLPDRSGYRGLACKAHNLADGSATGRSRQTRNVTTIRW